MTMICEILITIHYMNSGFHDLLRLKYTKTESSTDTEYIFSPKHVRKYKECLDLKQKFIMIYHIEELIVLQKENKE